MSRIGRLPISIPRDVKVDIIDGQVSVEGPKGRLSLQIHPGITVEVVGDNLVCRRPSDLKYYKALHGLTRSLLANMIEGVSRGFQKKLELVGIGYRASIQGRNLTLTLGYSHPINYIIPDGIKIEVENQTLLTVSGIDKQKVGEVAAHVRSLRPPEPYKGKGVRYLNERIRRKAGKTGA